MLVLLEDALDGLEHGVLIELGKESRWQGEILDRCHHSLLHLHPLEELLVVVDNHSDLSPPMSRVNYSACDVAVISAADSDGRPRLHLGFPAAEHGQDAHGELAVAGAEVGPLVALEAEHTLVEELDDVAA